MTSRFKTDASLQLRSEPGAVTIEALEPIEAGDGAAGVARLPRFSMVAYTGGPMRIAGWRHPVVVDLAGLSIPSQNRPIRFGHDMQSGVGHTDVIKIEDGKLLAAGVVSRDTAAAREIVASAKNGFPWQASIGAGVEEFEAVKAEQKVLVNGRTFSGPLNVVRRSSLGEISFVDLGADGNTTAQVAAVAPDMELEAEPTGECRPQAAAAAEAKPAAHSQSDSTLDREMQRLLAVRKICDGRLPEVEERAIREHWSLDKTALEVLRGTRPQAPAGHARDNTLTQAHLEAACMLSANLGEAATLYGEAVLEAARRRFRGGIGLQELLLEAAWANGYTGRNFRDARSVLRFAFHPQLEAGFSTVDIGGILSNVANKFLLDGFFSVERCWRNVAATRNVSDFKAVTSYRLVGADQYEQIAPGGEFKHGTLGQETYTNKADTYGLMLSIDRRDIINDDLGAITTVPRKLGRGSGLKINDVFWSTFLANSDFFKSDNSNYLSGADTALSIEGLSKAEVAFLEQNDSDGKPIGVLPAIVLVPPSLSAIGTQLYKSIELRDTTSSTKYPISNPHQGKFRLEMSRYLSNALYTGNSSKAWYLLADPNDLPVIEVAFLNGQESPTIETAEADFSVLGIQMRGYHDFGVALQDPRGGVKSKGEA